MLRLKHSPVRAWVLASALLAATATGACSTHRIEPASPGNSEKVYVCHKGKKTIEVADRALPAHIDHGDTLGACR